MLQVNGKTRERITRMFGSVDELERNYPNIAKTIVDCDERNDASVYATTFLKYDYKKNLIDLDLMIYGLEEEGFMEADITLYSDAGGAVLLHVLGGGERFTRVHQSIQSMSGCKITNVNIQAMFHDANGRTILRNVQSELKSDDNNITDMQLIHPVSNNELVDIGYYYNYATDYNYNPNWEGSIMIPATVFVSSACNIDMKAPISCKLSLIDTGGDDYSIEKNDTTFARFVDEATWKAMLASEKAPYPPIKSITNGYYALLISYDWGIKFKDIKKGNLHSPYVFSAKIKFSYENQSEGRLYIQSVINPRPYISGDNKMDIKMLNIHYDCIDTSAHVEVVREHGICRESLSSIKTGDCIYDNERKKSYAVEAIHTCMITGIVQMQAGDTQISVSLNHPIMSRNGWKEAKKLTTSDEIFNADGTYRKIDNINIEDKELEVCNLVIEGTHHSLFVNGIQVGDAQQDAQNLNKLKCIPVDEHLLQEVETYVNKMKNNAEI